MMIKYSACRTVNLIDQIIFYSHLLNLRMLYFSPINMTFFHFQYFGQQVNRYLITNFAGKFDGIVIFCSLSFCVSFISEK